MKSMMPSVRRRARWLAMPVGEEPSACASSVMLRSPSSKQEKDGHAFGVGNQFENGRETLDFHIIVPFVCYMNA